LPYSETFKEHLANPHHVGELRDADATVEETNPVCGDRLRLSLRVSNKKIEEVGYLAYGCPPTIVCGSLLTDLLIGKTIKEASAISRAELIEAAGGLPSRKHHAAALCIETLRAAVEKLPG
jgi:nitrogen fixation protein NifU and related proteins